MANYSYLFVSDTEPGRRDDSGSPSMLHISTGRNAIPFAFKVLLSGDPRAIKRQYGGASKSYMLVGNRQQGVERLTAFLQRVDVPQAQSLIAHTLSFLNKPEHRKTLFVLNPVDIFDLVEESHAQQMNRLMDEIKHIDATFDHQLARLQEPLGPITIGPGVRPGLIARLFGAKQQPAREVPFPEPLYRFETAGLLNWRGSDAERCF